MDLNQLKRDIEARMTKSIDTLASQLLRLRTGRANPALLDHVRVDYYGSDVPISQVANVVVEDARTLSITPWERTMIAAIEKAIMKSDLGLTPNTAGATMRINMPPLTEERRRDLVKVVKSEVEQTRVTIRGVRRDANTSIKDAVKAKTLTEDDEKRAEADIQKLTDLYISKADDVGAAKEKELMAV
ncbi:MAG: ribosome recycling factor [Polycyclovorans sp.]|jgi:ribosome recycling factor|nr:ribosome recycling factor [Gammaproteobacteria bacterium]MDP1543212.1 ribosome recycling factor [Polycyclovorans sp.]MEC8850237.1 ribosome recycling factor [Pseudomonadota bacterium]|tara:strand:+ start:15531 stop:16091 length:561 start_codon:yes stop_codon:yes gene_type:complete